MADNVTLNPGTGGDAIAADEIGGAKFQRVKLAHGADGVNDGDVANANPLPTKGSSTSRSDTYTAAANGTTVDVSARPVKRFAMQLDGTGGTPSAWNVVLEVSLDGTNWKAILTSTQADGDHAYLTTGPEYPAKFFRSRCVSITLGGATNLVVSILGME